MQVTANPEALLVAVNAANKVLRDALCYRDLDALVGARVQSLHMIGDTADWEIRSCLTQYGREAYAAYWQHFNAATTVDMYIREIACNATSAMKRELAEYVKAETRDLEDPDHFAYDLHSVLNEE